MMLLTGLAYILLATATVADVIQVGVVASIFTTEYAHTLV
jgi:hypothetical protein